MRFLIVVLLYANVSYSKCKRINVQLVRDYIIEHSVEKNVNPEVMLAMARTESSLNSCATNWDERGGVPSRGLFQIKDSTAKSVCNIKYPSSLYDYKLNIRCAIKYMNILLKQHKWDYIKAILSYNAGGYYICRQSHKEKGISCELGFPVNMEYLYKVYSYTR